MRIAYVVFCWELRRLLCSQTRMQAQSAAVSYRPVTSNVLLECAPAFKHPFVFSLSFVGAWRLGSATFLAHALVGSA